MTSTIVQYQTTAPECMGVFLTNPNGSTRTVAIEYGILGPNQQAVYNAFLSLAGAKASIVITNTPSGMDVSHPMLDEPDQTPSELDFNNMSEFDKEKVTAFINLLTVL